MIDEIMIRIYDIDTHNISVKLIIKLQFSSIFLISIKNINSK